VYSQHEKEGFHILVQPTNLTFVGCNVGCQDFNPHTTRVGPVGPSLCVCDAMMSGRRAARRSGVCGSRLRRIWIALVSAIVLLQVVLFRWALLPAPRPGLPAVLLNASRPICPAPASWCADGCGENRPPPSFCATR